MTDSVNTRELILGILMEVTKEGSYSHLVIRSVLDKYQYLEKKERAFITRVSEGTIQYMIELDYIINQFSKVKVNKMKPVIRNILRMSVYQLKYMDSVPRFCKRGTAQYQPQFKHYHLPGWAERPDPISVCALFHAGVDRETVDQRLWHGADGERAAGIFAGDTGYDPYQSSEDHTGSAGKAVERGRRYRRENGLRRYAGIKLCIYDLRV